MTSPVQPTETASAPFRPRPIRYRTWRNGGAVVRPNSRAVLLAAMNGRVIEVTSKQHTTTLRRRFSKLVREVGGKFAAFRFTQQKIGHHHWILRVVPRNAAVERLPCDPGYRPGNARFTEAVDQLLAGKFVDLATRADAQKLQAAFWRIPKEKRTNLVTQTTRVHGGYRVRTVVRSAEPPRTPERPGPYGRGVTWLHEIATELMVQRWTDQLHSYSDSPAQR